MNLSPPKSKVVAKSKINSTLNLLQVNKERDEQYKSFNLGVPLPNVKSNTKCGAALDDSDSQDVHESKNSLQLNETIRSKPNNDFSQPHSERGAPHNKSPSGKLEKKIENFNKLVMEESIKVVKQAMSTKKLKIKIPKKQK